MYPGSALSSNPSWPVTTSTRLSGGQPCRLNENQPRLAIAIVLRSASTGCLVHFGMKCSSWCRVNVGTSGRSACSSVGNCYHVSVKQIERAAGYLDSITVCRGFRQLPDMSAFPSVLTAKNHFARLIGDFR